MSEASHPYGINWSTYSQVRLEIESELRGKIHADIQRYADHCRNLGMNTHFTSGLDVAADIGLIGLAHREQDLKDGEDK